MMLQLYDTLELLKQYAGGSPFAYRIDVNGQCLGAAQNFSRALGLCGGKYVALCDQDDIWEKGKLGLSLKAIFEAEEQWGPIIPILVHSDLKVINSEGNIVSPSFMKMRNIKHLEERVFKQGLLRNSVYLLMLLEGSYAC